jgi:hypothetical protein
MRIAALAFIAGLAACEHSADAPSAAAVGSDAAPTL